MLTLLIVVLMDAGLIYCALRLRRHARARRHLAWLTLAYLLFWLVATIACVFVVAVKAMGDVGGVSYDPSQTARVLGRNGISDAVNASIVVSLGLLVPFVVAMALYLLTPNDSPPNAPP